MGGVGVRMKMLKNCKATGKDRIKGDVRKMRMDEVGNLNRYYMQMTHRWQQK